MSVSQDYDVDLGGVLFRGGTTYALTEVTGLDMPDVDLTITQKAGAHGAYVAGHYFKERTVTLAGRMRSDDNPTAAQTALATLRSAFFPTPEGTLLTVQLPGIGPVQMLVMPQSLRYSIKNVESTVGIVDFLGTVVASDPRFYGTSENIASLGIQVVGGTTIVRAFPFAFSMTNSNTLTCVNSGTLEAPIQIRVSGAVADLRVTNNTTGESTSLTLDTAPGDALIIDTLTHTVTHNGYPSYSSLISGSAFLTLAPGTNTITVGASAGSGTVSVAWRNTWA